MEESPVSWFGSCLLCLQYTTSQIVLIKFPMDFPVFLPRHGVIIPMGTPWGSVVYSQDTMVRYTHTV